MKNFKRIGAAVLVAALTSTAISASADIGGSMGNTTHGTRVWVIGVTQADEDYKEKYIDSPDPYSAGAGGINYLFRTWLEGARVSSCAVVLKENITLKYNEYLYRTRVFYLNGNNLVIPSDRFIVVNGNATLRIVEPRSGEPGKISGWNGKATVNGVEVTVKNGIAVLDGGKVEYLKGNPYGDLNGDGKINAKDATYALKAAAGRFDYDYDWNLTQYGEAYSDVTGDGVVNAKDVTEILKYVAGLPSTIDNL